MTYTTIIRYIIKHMNVIYMFCRGKNQSYKITFIVGKTIENIIQVKLVIVILYYLCYITYWH